ncbi:MAG: N-acetyl-gamma-glutamyl-phosphate reductase [Thermodesulfobacteriota bacterium]
MGPIKVGLVGVTGYAGMELLRLLDRHPGFELAAVTSRQKSGHRVQDIFPQCTDSPVGRIEISDPEPESLARDCSLVFLAVPQGTALEMTPGLLDQGLQVVDFSADFRLRSAPVYTQWYGLEHSREDLLEQAVYGLPEIYSSRIKQARLLANPGCYPTSVLLGLKPALEQGLIHPEGIIVDSKSGASGAGRSPKQDTLFCEVHDDFRAYGLTRHRHTPEMEQELGLLAGQEIQISFNPHLLPVQRGILSSIYCSPQPGLDEEGLRQAYQEAYSQEPWVRILPRDVLPRLSWVRGSMYCDISLVWDRRLNRLIILSAIDNLCRGASGQALANANLMNGYSPELGLELPPLTP